ncbi:MAG: glycosyltransferase family 4 protein [Candidatus Stahlbacteria bacterium]|nr:glycosyltransferase family 4 protein [Candidatus Stahlbacteria bacterium]
MKISILCHNLSCNGLGRAYLLAKILQRHYKVEIVGPLLGDKIWFPLRDIKDIDYKFIRLTNGRKVYQELKELLKLIDGDIIYTIKPLFTSFGIGVIKKLITGRPLISDIDDLETAFWYRYKNQVSKGRMAKDLFYYLRHPYSLNFYWNSLLCEKMNFLRPNLLVDGITVSNKFLQDKFGGTIVRHARDTETFNPEKFDPKLIKKNYGVEGRKIIMFFGTPGSHQGIEVLIEAINLIGIPNKVGYCPNVMLILVGIDKNNLYDQGVVRLANTKLNNRVKIFGQQVFQKIPELLSLSDIIVVPQKNEPPSIGQVPAKIFDAMAMAKPIIATKISDLPEILDDCGYIIEPDNPQKLADAIQYVLKHPKEAELKGQKVREKCIAKYSYDAMEKVLTNIFKKYE